MKIVRDTECACCGDMFDKNVHMHYINDEVGYVCSDCSGSLITCDDCGYTHYNEDVFYYSESVTLCPSCVNDYEICDYCDDYIASNEAVTGPNNRIYCPCCIEEVFSTCDSCGANHYNSDLYANDNDEYICINCVNEMDLVICESCNHVHNQETHFCPNCLYGIVFPYHYKPSPEFKSLSSEDNGYFFGIELELELGNSYNGHYTKNKEKFVKIVENEDSIYVKKDGSLDYGYEIVSHPMTIPYFDKSLSKIMDKCDMEFSEFNGTENRTCGFHVHMSNEQLANNNVNVMKMIWFLELNYDFTLAFSRRERYYFDRWAGLYGVKDCKTIDKVADYICDSGTNRRRIINIQGEHTTEFRLFKGTTSSSDIKATLQFLTLLCELCNNEISLLDLARVNAKEYFYGKYKELDSYLDQYVIMKKG